MDDLRAVMTSSELPPPEEAASNINRSNMAEINPDSYSELKSELEPKILATERVPASVSPVTENFVKQSKQHLALAQDDIPALSDTESHLNYHYNKTFVIPDKIRERNKLARKEMFSTEDLSEEEEEMLQDLNGSISELSQGQPKDMGDIEKFIGDVGAAGVDILRSYNENKGLVGTIIGGATATTALIGGAVGGLPGAALGAPVGAVSGTATAMAVVPMYDSFMETSASVYSDLKYGTKDDGTPLNLSKERRQAVAGGVGLVSGVAAYFGGKILANNNPFLKKFLDPNSAAKYVIGNPALMAKVDILGGIVKSGAGEGVEEFVQNYAEVIATELGKMDESEEGFINALGNVADKVFTTANFKESAYNAAVGFGAGGAVSSTNALAYKSVKADYQKAQQVSKTKQEVLSTQNMMIEANARLSQTKIQQLSPEEAKNFKKNLFEKLGFEPNAWFSIDDLKAFANSPEKGAKIKSLLDLNPEMVQLAKDTNTHVQLSKAEVLDIMTEFPDIADHMRLTPDGQNPKEIRNEAQKFADNLSKADSVRASLMEKLGVVENTDQVNSVLKEALSDNDLKDSPYFASRDQYAEYEPLAQRPPEALQLEQQAEEIKTQKKELKKKIKEATEGGMSPEGIETLNKDLALLETDHDTIKESLKQYKSILSSDQTAALNKAHLGARMEIDKLLVSDVNDRFERYEDSEYNERTEQDLIEETAKLEKENLIIDNYIKPAHDPVVAATFTKGHEKPGFPAYAIDPRTLSVAQKAIYLDDNGIHPSIKRNMKKRKAFVVGGISLEEAAMLNGVESGDALLKILAETPTKKQVQERVKKDPIRERVERNKIQAANEATRLKAIDESFSKVTNLHLKEMQQMVGQSWNTVKRGIIKISGKVPTIQELNTKAATTVKSMKIRDLNPTQFKMGEARSQKDAIKAFVDGKIEQSFAIKEKAALNSELMKETLKARDKVAKAQKFWKKMKDPSKIQELKDAKMFDAVNQFMEAYKLDGAIPSEGKQKAFNDFIKRQVAEGKDVPVIPESLTNTQASFKDLTVDQYQAITEMGQFMLKQAQLKNKLLENAKNRKDFETLERVAEGIDSRVQEHPDFDPARAQRDEKLSEDANTVLRIQNGAKTFVSAVKNAKHIIAKLDKYKSDGFFYRTFIDPLVRSQTAKRQENLDLVDYKVKVINEFYENDKAYVAAMEERIEIPEFSGINSLNNGEMNRVKLFRLFALAGDESGRERIKNFTDAQGKELDFETVLKVFDQHISEKEALFIQNYFVNPYKRYTKAYFDMHKRTTGIEPEMVKGAPFIHKGKEIEGGYQPLTYQRIPDSEKAAQQHDAMADKELLTEDDGFFARRRASEMTKQGRTKDRTGSKRPLDLGIGTHFDALEEIIHDIHFREVGIDMMKILKNADNVMNIKSVVGSRDYNVLFDGIKDVVSKVSDKDTSVVHREQNRALKWGIGSVKSLHAFKTISFNVVSAAVQFDSLLYLPLRTGPKAMLHMSKTIAKMAAGAFSYERMAKDAAEILPDIKFEQDAIDDTLIKSIDDTIPQGKLFHENYKKLGKGINRLGKLRQKTMDLSFEMLRYVDKMNKVVAVHTITSQFMAGDIEGYDLDTITKMSDAEKITTLKRVVKQNVDLTLTASSTLDKTALEKHQYGAIFANYWTDGRSRLNTLMSQADQFGNKVKAKDYRGAATQAMYFALITGASGAFVNFIRGKDEERLEELKNIKDPSDAAAFALEGMYDIFMSPMMDSIPVVNSVKYSIESTIEYGGKQIRPVSVPVLAVMTDIVAGAVSLYKKSKGKSMKKRDRKALITLAGYGVGGAPTNVINKIIDIADNSRGVKRDVKELTDDIKKYLESSKEYKETFKDDPEAQEFIQDLEQFDKSLPKTELEPSTAIPEGTKDSIKKAVSGGDWTKYDEETGGVGIYQYTERAWTELMVAHPDLGLTENGRLAKDPAQQEKAMDREITESTKSLIAYQYEVSKENILGIHKFGFDTFSTILDAKDEQKLSDILGDEAKNPGLKDFKTVGELKAWLKKQVK